MLSKPRSSCPYVSTQNRHFWAKKVVIRTFRTVLRKKKAKKQRKTSIWRFAFLVFEIANFPGNLSFAWCNITHFRLTSRLKSFSQMPWSNLSDPSKSCQSKLNWRSGGKIGGFHKSRGEGIKKLRKFPDMSNDWWSTDCLWANCQDN